jgi:DNA-binding GntR family transcriptional regulator
LTGDNEYCIQNTTLTVGTPPIIARTPLRDEVYRQLSERIHRGELAPGTRVRDTQIAAQLGVSRTPVREALLRLVREGVLEADMGRGFSVCRLDAAEMRETGSILSSLEGLALQLSGEIPPARLARMGEIDRELAVTRGDADRCIALDEEWHCTLLQGCPNRRLLAMISELWQVPRRYMRAYLREAGRVTLSTQHHARIVEALRRNDLEAARQRFTHHWDRGIEELSAWIGR